MVASTSDAYMNVRQVAEYLHLNEKKVYELLKEQQIPATKVTGKWLFPRGLLDRWITESANGGTLSDRLTIAGSDDPLFNRVVLMQTQEMAGHGIVNYTPTGTRMGLKLLDARRIDACCLHWGPSEESHFRHPALLKQHRQHNQWVLMHLYRREQGLLLHPDIVGEIPQTGKLFQPTWRWALRQDGAGSQRFLLETLVKSGYEPESLNVSTTACSEHEAASLIAMRQADVAPGPRSAAVASGLAFISIGWESFDIAMTRAIWFRHLFQSLVKRIESDHGQRLAMMLQGYDLSECGMLRWGER